MAKFVKKHSITQFMSERNSLGLAKLLLANVCHKARNMESRNKWNAIQPSTKKVSSGVGVGGWVVSFRSYQVYFSVHADCQVSSKHGEKETTHARVSHPYTCSVTPTCVWYDASGNSVLKCDVIKILSYRGKRNRGKNIGVKLKGIVTESDKVLSEFLTFERVAERTPRETIKVQTN